MPILTLNVFAGYEKRITIPSAVLEDSWITTPTSLNHILNVKSTIYKRIPQLKLNTLYRISYEVYDYVNCTVMLKVGTQQGTTVSTNGVVTQEFLISSDSDRTLSFVSDGILKIRGISYQEKVVSTENIPFTDKTKFQDKSWTISYSFYNEEKQRWVGWHSYKPLYYIHNQSHLYSFIGDSNIWKHNVEGLYQNYYGQRYPFIVEYVSISDPLQTRIWEDLTFQTKARKWNSEEEQYQDERFVTFNKLTAYNDRQSTGELEIVVKDTQPSPEDWYQQQIVNTPGTILTTRKDRDWNINELRDNIIDPALPLFSSSWAKLQDSYFMDKVENQDNISFIKDWNEMEMLRDKFLVIRLKFDNFEDINLIFNFSIETEQKSNR